MDGSMFFGWFIPMLASGSYLTIVQVMLMNRKICGMKT